MNPCLQLQQLSSYSGQFGVVGIVGAIFEVADNPRHVLNVVCWTVWGSSRARSLGFEAASVIDLLTGSGST